MTSESDEDKVLTLKQMLIDLRKSSFDVVSGAHLHRRVLLRR